MKSQLVMRDGQNMLYGEITKKQLYFDFPEWQKKQEAYQPDSLIVEQLKKLEGEFEVQIFLGTWCGDSRREVPHFFKIAETAQLTPKMHVKLYALDRQLEMDSTLPEDHNIERVATFVFYRDGREIGRIIESPEAFLLEEDLLHILSEKNDKSDK